VPSDFKALRNRAKHLEDGGRDVSKKPGRSSFVQELMKKRQGGSLAERAGDEEAAGEEGEKANQEAAFTHFTNNKTEVGKAQEQWMQLDLGSLDETVKKEKWWHAMGDDGVKGTTNPLKEKGITDSPTMQSQNNKNFDNTLNKPRWVLDNVIKPAVAAMHQYEEADINFKVYDAEEKANKKGEEIDKALGDLGAKTEEVDNFLEDVSRRVVKAHDDLQAAVKYDPPGKVSPLYLESFQNEAYDASSKKLEESEKIMKEHDQFYDNAHTHVEADVNAPALKDYVMENVPETVLDIINGDNTEGFLDSALSDLSAVSQAHAGTVNQVLSALTQFDSMVQDVGDAVADGGEALSSFEGEGRDIFSGVESAMDEGVGTLQDAESELIASTTSGIGGMTNSINDVWQGIESLEESSSDEIGAVEENTENAMETTREDEAAIEEVTADKLLHVDNTMRELEKNVDRVADKGLYVADAQADLEDEGEESLEALKETATALVAQIRLQGDEKRESDVRNVTRKLDRAVEKADKWLTNEIEKFVGNTSKTLLNVDRELKKGSTDVDKYAARVETAVNLMAPRTEALVAGVAGAKKELRRTKASALRKWENFKGLEESRTEDFKYAVESKETHFKRDLNSLGPILDGALESYEKLLTDAERDGGTRVADAKSSAEAELEEMVDRLREEVEANPIKYTPEELKGKAKKIQEVIRAFPPTVQQEARAVTIAWNRNENKIDDLDAFGDRNQDILMNAVRTALNSALNNTALRMERVRASQNQRFMEANATQRRKFAKLRENLEKVVGSMTERGDDFRANLSTAFTKLDGVYTDLQDNGRAINEQVVAHDQNMAVRTAAARASYGAIQKDLVAFRSAVEAALHDGVQEMLLSAENLGTSISDVGKFLEPRVRELVTAYIEGGAEKAREVYDKNRKREEDLEPLALKQHLDEVQHRTAVGDDEAKRVSDGIGDQEQVYAQRSRYIVDDGTEYIRNAEVQSLQNAQRTISEATTSSADAVKDEVQLTDEEIQEQAKELQGWGSDLDSALETFNLVGSSEVDNETHDVLKFQADLNNQRRINEKYGTQVAAAVRDLQEAGKHDEAKFLGAMGRVGQILALSLEGGKAEFDSQVAGMKSFFTNDVEGRMKTSKTTFDSYVQALDNALEPLQTTLGNLLTQEKTYMSEYEAKVAGQETWTENELLPGAAVQQDKIQAACARTR
jgi:Tfp pilus assembly protein PilE